MNNIAPFKNTRSAPVTGKQIRFNARSFVAFALAPEAPLSEWFDGLDQWTENSPGFFAGRPVVLNLNHITLDTEEIIDLVDGLADRGIRVCAIEANGIDDLGLDLPPLLTGARTIAIEEKQPERRQPASTPANAPANTNQQAETARATRANTLIIETPIRSGQSIFHPHGDVIVLGSVGSGSEIIAGGSVHIYGTLRGRAFAGVMGNPDARIFCRKNEAELLAVDGWYRTADDMEPSSRGGAIQAYLDNEVIWVSALG
ncbi:MAG: septum site-determining protein MinC [Hyphomicrobiales bacterium]|nr:septum site-determining protein MinC [Hyphomicrobiales bacterium]